MLVGLGVLLAGCASQLPDLGTVGDGPPVTSIAEPSPQSAQPKPTQPGAPSQTAALADAGTSDAAVPVVTIPRTQRSLRKDLFANRDQRFQAASNSEPGPTRGFEAPPRSRGLEPATDDKPPRNAAQVVRVFYATTRGLEGNGASRHFGASRGKGITHGFADVSIPPKHTVGALERPTIWRFELSQDEKRHVVIKEILSTEKDYFDEVLADHARGSDRRALVYVHGFNTSFPHALMRTAQLKFDLCFKGPVVLFSWPSFGSGLRYAADAEAAEWSQADFADFLAGLMRTEAVREVTVIAFSMGARPTAVALARATKAVTAEQRAKLENIVLAAPDIDKDVFLRDLYPQLHQGRSRITLYASERDRALAMSYRFHSAPRLGSLKPAPVIAAGIDTIDATRVDTSLSGHGYYADNRSVVSDLFYLIHERLPPSRRATLRPEQSAAGGYWAFAQ